MFHLRVGEMTPTLQDVSMLTSLPIDGAPVTRPGGAVAPDDLCLRLLGRVSPHTAYVTTQPIYIHMGSPLSKGSSWPTS